MPLAMIQNMSVVLDPPNNKDKHNHNNDDDPSTSSWTAISSPSWRANFGWLLTGATSSALGGTAATATTTTAQLQAKELEIVQCLQGNHQEDVDLWHLRQLALSPGGFVSTTLRKRAWPKVVGAHLLLLQKQQQQPQEFVEPSPANVRQVHHLVRRTHWNIEEHLRRSRKEQVRYRQQQQARPQPHVVMEEEEEDNNRPRKVSFVLPHTIHAIHNMSSMDEASVDTATLSLQSSCSKATRQEQQVLTNVLLNLLRQPQRYFPFVGIQSVTAVLLLQLESPSLASLVLQQLASYSLHRYCVVDDADDSGSGDVDGTSSGSGPSQTITNGVEPQKDNDDDTPTTCNQSQTRKDAHDQDNDDDDNDDNDEFWKLLQRVDCKLWRHLTDNGNGISKTPDCIVTSWIPCWFAQDIPHLDVIGRLWDVFMVSQPSCCLYMSVALTVTFRNLLLSTPPDFATLTEAFGRLPSQLCEPDETEVVIATCLQYMERYPPPPRRQLQKSTVAVPSWATAPTAPNDWALLQQAKAMRNNNNNNPEMITTTKKTARSEEDSRDAAVTLALERFPQAAVAAGVAMSHPPPFSWWRRLALLFLFVVVGFAVGVCACLRNDIPIDWTWTMPAAEIQSEAIAKARTMMNRWALPNNASKYVPRQLFWEASSNSNAAVSSTTEQGVGLLAEQTQTRGEQEAQRRYQQERVKATELMEEASKQEEAHSNNNNNAQAKTTQEEKMAKEQARIAESSRLVVERIAKEKRLVKEQKQARIAKEAEAAAKEQTRLESQAEQRVSGEEKRVAAEQAAQLEAERIEKEQQRLAQEKEKDYLLEATRVEEERLAEYARLEDTEKNAEEESLAEQARVQEEQSRLAEEANPEAARIGEEERLLAEETSKAKAEMKAEDARLQEEETTRETEEIAGIEEAHHPAIEQSRSEAARLADETSEQTRQAETDARDTVARMMVASEHDKTKSRDSNDRPAGDDLNEPPLLMEADIIDEAIRILQDQEGGAPNEEKQADVLKDKDTVAPQQVADDMLKSYRDDVETFQRYWKEPNEDDDNENDSNSPGGIQIVAQKIGNQWGKFRKWSANQLERRRVRKVEHQRTRKERKL